MLGIYEGVDFSDLCALTRERRREELCSAAMMAFPDLVRLERAYERVHGVGEKPPRREDSTLRFRVRSYEFCGAQPTSTKARIRLRKHPEKDHARLSPLIFRTLWLLQAGACYLCTRPFVDDDWATVDHVTPKAKGGPDAGNILLAHLACNNQKSDRDPTPDELLYLANANGRWLGAFAQAESELRDLWAA